MIFKPEHNVFILHGLLTGINRAYGYRPHEWDDLEEKAHLDYALAVSDVTPDGPDASQWFSKHWRLFPFGESNSDNLLEVQQDMVECVYEQMLIGTQWYNSEFSKHPAGNAGNGDVT